MNEANKQTNKQTNKRDSNPNTFTSWCVYGHVCRQHILDTPNTCTDSLRDGRTLDMVRKNSFVNLKLYFLDCQTVDPCKNVPLFVFILYIRTISEDVPSWYTPMIASRKILCSSTRVHLWYSVKISRLGRTLISLREVKPECSNPVSPFISCRQYHRQNWHTNT